MIDDMDWHLLRDAARNGNTLAAELLERASAAGWLPEIGPAAGTGDASLPALVVSGNGTHRRPGQRPATRDDIDLLMTRIARLLGVEIHELTDGGTTSDVADALTPTAKRLSVIKNARTRDIIRSYCDLGMTAPQIAARYKLETKTIDNIINGARGKYGREIVPYKKSGSFG
jgi:hypothetical protein